MSFPAAINLEIYRGDTWSQQFRFLIDGTPVNLTGATIEAEARAANNGASYPLVVTVNPVTNVVSLQLPPESLPVGFYDFDIEVTQSGVIKTWVRGTLSVNRDVTNELP